MIPPLPTFPLDWDLCLAWGLAPSADRSAQGGAYGHTRPEAVPPLAAEALADHVHMRALHSCDFKNSFPCTKHLPTPHLPASPLPGAGGIFLADPASRPLQSWQLRLRGLYAKCRVLSQGSLSLLTPNTALSPAQQSDGDGIQVCECSRPLPLPAHKTSSLPTQLLPSPHAPGEFSLDG